MPRVALAIASADLGLCSLGGLVFACLPFLEFFQPLELALLFLAKLAVCGRGAEQADVEDRVPLTEARKEEVQAELGRPFRSRD